MFDIDTVNRMDREAFVRAFGGVFEHSPWIAERAWAARPFDSPEALHAAMIGVVRAASHPAHLADEGRDVVAPQRPREDHG